VATGCWLPTDPAIRLEAPAVRARGINQVALVRALAGPWPLLRPLPLIFGQPALAVLAARAWASWKSVSFFGVHRILPFWESSAW